MPPDLARLAARMTKSWRSRHFMNSAAPRVDALIASFPKCGRTWLRFALANYLAEAFELEIEPDLHSMFKIIPNFDADPLRGLPAFRYSAARPAMPLVGVTHSPAEITARLPIIFIVRDPRDVVVSNYFHLTRHKGKFSGTIAEFIDDSGQGLAKYIRYLNAWARFLSHSTHHVTSYELMSADAAAELRKILRFLSIPVAREALSLAVRRSTFESMQAHERAEGIPAHHYDRSDDESLRMRRGVVHGFRGYLTPGQVDLIEKRCRGELSRAAQALVNKYSLKLNRDGELFGDKRPLSMAG